MARLGVLESIILIASLVVACNEVATPGVVVVEKNSPAIGAAGVLSQHVGTGAGGGTGGLRVLLERGCKLPCTETFEIVIPGKFLPEIPLKLFRGEGEGIADAHLLGTFTIVGLIPPVDGGTAVRITLSAEGRDLTLRASDPSTGAALQIQVSR